ncbi:hypothetical protein H0E87_001324 [Populus deltoides]|uniref:Thioredoxin domain-containing protein n=1 Tax=Populus deltoides TaxID=3696 RepID=A0A8T2ZR08_POPDE|nr:hypothetical protein H0E87_001324 [Populus deltoides]
MSDYLSTTLLTKKKEIDCVIRDAIDKVLVLRFGRASDPLSKSAREVSKFATIALVDIDSEDVQVYVNYFDITLVPSTVFFFNAHHMKMDSGTADHTKWVGAFHRKQDFIDVVETAYRPSLPAFSPISEDGDSFAKHIQEIHADVWKRIQDNNARTISIIKVLSLMLGAFVENNPKVFLDSLPGLESFFKWNEKVAIGFIAENSVDKSQGIPTLFTGPLILIPPIHLKEAVDQIPRERKKVDVSSVGASAAFLLNVLINIQNWKSDSNVEEEDNQSWKSDSNV